MRRILKATLVLLHYDSGSYLWYRRLGPLGLVVTDNFGGRFTVELFWRSVLLWMPIFDRKLIR
jgi:hypothetical protein